MPNLANTIIRAGKANRAIRKSRIVGDGYDSNWERDYAAHLNLRKAAGEIAWWEHHLLTINLDAKTKYKPDFIVGMTDGSIEVHEVKGFERRDAVPRFRWAAQRCPWMRFVMVRKVSKGWEVYRELT
jgi:hypothetical protein